MVKQWKTKYMCDWVNHTRFPKEDHVPDWVCRDKRDKHGNKGDCVRTVVTLRIVVEHFIKYAVCVVRIKWEWGGKICGWGWDFMFI